MLYYILIDESINLSTSNVNKSRKRSKKEAKIRDTNDILKAEFKPHCSPRSNVNITIPKAESKPHCLQRLSPSLYNIESQSWC